MCAPSNHPLVQIALGIATEQIVDSPAYVDTFPASPMSHALLRHCVV